MKIKSDVIDTTIYLKHFDKIAKEWVVVDLYKCYDDCHAELRTLIEKYPDERFAVLTTTSVFREV